MGFDRLGDLVRGGFVVGSPFAVGRVRHDETIHADRHAHEGRLDQSSHYGQYRRQRRWRKSGQLEIREQSAVVVPQGGCQPGRNRARHRADGDRRGGAGEGCRSSPSRMETPGNWLTARRNKVMKSSVGVKNFVEDTWFGENGYFHGDEMRVNERLWKDGQNL